MGGLDWLGFGSSSSSSLSSGVGSLQLPGMLLSWWLLAGASYDWKWSIIRWDVALFLGIHSCMACLAFDANLVSRLMLGQVPLCMGHSNRLDVALFMGTFCVAGCYVPDGKLRIRALLCS